ncbi:MAG TPA: ABC transporter permease [Gemmatimonadaceae bacterium]
MSLWRHVTRGLHALANRRASDRDARDEIQDYLDRATAAHAERGLSPAEALRAARMELGNATVAREQLRTYGWENTVESVAADLRYAIRRLRAAPGFTVVTVLTLALGIGATTAIFGAVNPILFASLPYPHADRLVTVADQADDGSPQDPTLGTFNELRARSTSFAALAAADQWGPSLTGTTEPERLHGQRVSADYFRALGVSPTVGRDFSNVEDRVGGPNVAILSDRLVQRRFGGDRSIVGRTVMLSDDVYVVIGVMPRDFANVIAPSTDIWAPMQEPAPAPFTSREWGHHYRIIGRLAANATIDGASRETKAIGRATTPEFPRPVWADMRHGLLVHSMQDDVAYAAKPALFAMIGSALLLLVIACVNVTNLLIARGAQRRGEFAMRLALGAGRGRLLRQLLTESLMLAAIGGVLGLVVAVAGVRALVALSPPGLPRVDAIRVDGSVFVFALAATTIVGLAVGFVPALGAARAGLRDGLQESSRRTVGGRALARSSLVVAEVALALVLLASAGLLMRSLDRLFAVAPGFDAPGLLTMQIVDAGRAYHSDSARARYFDQALDAVRHVPGVAAAAMTSQLPLSGELDGYGYEFQSKPSLTPGEDGSALRYAVSPGYFATMRIPLRRGRLFDASDRSGGGGGEGGGGGGGSPEVVVLSEAFARREFGDENPIGQRVRFGPEAGSTRPWDVVVGVVGDVKQESLALSQTDAFYVPIGQWSWVDNVQSLVVRTTGDAAALAPSVRRAIWSVDPDQPVRRIVTMNGLIAASASQRRFAFLVIETFALAALVLAAVGMYGVISGSVTERTREIGIRTALGAASRDIVAHVIGGGVKLAALGVAIGLGGAVAASRLLESLLFGVSRLDPITYVGVTVLLTAVAVLASWLPAQRAARVDPSITLRAE